MRRKKRHNAAKSAKQVKVVSLLHFVAGCGRTQQAPSDLADIAYDKLEFPECVTCPHRVSPEGANDFCVWRPDTQHHPFASLRDFPL